MQFEQMTLKEFAAWLRSQPADRMYNETLRSECCPIARFTGRPAAAGMVGMPDWANYFIDRFDDALKAQATQAYALDVLQMTEARFASAA